MKIYCEPFNITKHFKILDGWLESRKAYRTSEHEIPDVGVMVYVDGKPVCAAFLRKVEGNTAQLDGLTTNPEASPEDRHKAIESAVNYITEEAKKLKLFGIIAHTEDLTVVSRALYHHGFILSREVVLVLPLNGSN